MCYVLQKTTKGILSFDSKSDTQWHAFFIFSHQSTTSLPFPPYPTHWYVDVNNILSNPFMCMLVSLTFNAMHDMDGDFDWFPFNTTGLSILGLLQVEVNSHVDGK